MHQALICINDKGEQSITQALYALTVQSQPPVLPLKVHVLTTASGKDLIQERLLEGSPGWFQAFCTEYGLQNDIHLEAQNIHVIKHQGQALQGIHGPEQHHAAADTILEKVRELTSNQEGQLHSCIPLRLPAPLSLPFLLAMQLHARPNDELSCLMLHPFFESHPYFYFPPKSSKKFSKFSHSLGQEISMDSTDSGLHLAPVPFLFVRDFFKSGQLQNLDFGSLLEYGHSLARPKPDETVLQLEKQELQINGTKVKLTALEAAIYYQLAQNKTSCPRKGPCSDCSKCFIRPYELDLQELLQFLRYKWGKMSGKLELMEKQLQQKNELRAWFLQHRSRINRKLRQHDIPQSLQITAVGKYGETAYGIKQDKNSLIIVW